MLMRHWTTLFIKENKKINPLLALVGRVAYYYLILVGLFILYYVQQEHTPAPYIYNNF